MKRFKFALLCSLALTGANAMACYTVYDKSNQVVYNAQTAPVDMSRPIHETLPAVFPGGHMVFAVGGECPASAPLPRLRMAGAGSSVLLTERRTAQAMNAAHIILASGAALVSQRPAAMTAGVVVAQAAPVPIALAPVIAPPVQTRALPRTSGTVITEMRDPPMTVVQSPDGVIVGAMTR